MNTIITFVAAALLCLLVGFCSTETISVGHVGVKKSLGKTQKEAVGEGLQFKNPFTESFVEVETKQHTFDFSEECPTSDSQIVTVHYSVFAKIDPAHASQVVNEYSNSGFDDLFKKLAGSTTRGAIKQLTVVHRAEEALAKRDQLRGELLERLQKDVNHLFTINDVQIGEIRLSEQLREAIEKKQVREQEALAVKYDLEKANKQAEITIAQAKAEAEAIRLKGIAIRENPSVIQLDIVKAWAAGAKTPNTVVVGAGQGGANILLPIEK